MPIDRRLFLAGASALAVPGVAPAAVSAAGANAAQKHAIAAIAAYLEAHRAFFALPAMGLVLVDGPFTATILSGEADYLQTQPLTGREMWQIGSISKSFVALVCLQLAAEKKLGLGADVRTIFPEVPLPDAGGPFTIRGLLDHTTGLPDFAPVFAMDGSKLWQGFPAGAHWSYSNTAYDILGKAIERIEGKPLAAVIEARIARPLGMADTRGAITWADRSRYTASYSMLRPDRPVRQKNPLAPAAWVDTTLGAGSVASTLPDMARYLRYLIALQNGAGAPLLSNDLARLWLADPVVQDPENKAETYGLGLMHREVDGQKLLHHTGGMVSFSSSFHTDGAAGTGAFASCAIGGTGYRPRLLTLYATQALRLAKAGKPIPPPPALGVPPLKDAAALAGRYSSGGKTLTIASTPAGLTLATGGKAWPVEVNGGGSLVTDHPDFAAFPIVVVRDGDKVIALDYASGRYGKDGAMAPALPPTSPRIAARAGRYQSDDPWIGGFSLVARGDTLYIEGTEPITEIANDEWRLANPDWNPERLRFTGFMNGRPLLAIWSGRVLERRDS
jgi:CubicO group peptidase (beta-lactamase class C family)